MDILICITNTKIKDVALLKITSPVLNIDVFLDHKSNKLCVCVCDRKELLNGLTYFSLILEFDIVLGKVLGNLAPQFVN